MVPKNAMNITNSLERARKIMPFIERLIIRDAGNVNHRNSGDHFIVG